MWGEMHAQDSWAKLDSWAELNMGAGLCGRVLLATPLGMRRVDSLQIGEALRTSAGGPARLAGIAPAPNHGWMRIPAMALGNRNAIVLGQGQNLLIESSYAMRLAGSAAVVVPARALRGWRGIASCAAPPSAFRLALERPALVLGGAGMMIAVAGPVQPALRGGLGKGQLPPVPNLSLASAQQLIACLIAADAGAALRGLRPQAAVF